MAIQDHPCAQHTPPEAPSSSERRTWWTVGLTVSMMVVELAVGTWTRSLALTADGWHMGTHAGALAVSALAWWYARTRAGRAEFTFGTAKVHALAGYTNALALLAVAAQMVFEAVRRLLHPTSIRYGEAIAVAVAGLLVNLVSAWLLMPAHDHHGHDHHGHDHHGHDHHGHDHHGHDHHGHDHGGAQNLRGAYLHVIADALTSVLAIAALVLGQRLGWTALDALSAIVGALLITRWGVGLLRETSRPLLDRAPTQDAVRRIREALEGTGATVVDLHVWEPIAGRWYCAVSLRAVDARPLQEYRTRLEALGPLTHLTVEIHPG
jgi:cation diffusion facilitator family transporter